MRRPYEMGWWILIGSTYFSVDPTAPEIRRICMGFYGWWILLRQYPYYTPTRNCNKFILKKRHDRLL